MRAAATAITRIIQVGLPFRPVTIPMLDKPPNIAATAAKNTAELPSDAFHTPSFGGRCGRNQLGNNVPTTASPSMDATSSPTICPSINPTDHLC